MNSIVNARLKQIKPSPSMAAKIVVDELRRAGREIADFTPVSYTHLTLPTNREV